jgi:hypothetical protein
VPAVDPIKIKGVREFQAALKAMDGESQKQLRVVFNSVAETIAAGARRRVPTRTGRAKASIKVASGQREAKIKGGGGKAGYYPWLDFGGRTGRKKSVRRPFVERGRYLYPTYDASRPQIQAALEKALADLARTAGLEVS